MTDPNTAPPPLTAAALDEIERLSRAATPGPYRSQRNKHPNLDGSPWGGLDKTRLTWSGYQAEKDADYAVAACNAAPSLAAEVRAARELVRLMDEERDSLRHQVVTAEDAWENVRAENAALRRENERLCVHGAEPTSEEWRLLREQNAALRAKLDALVAAAEAYLASSASCDPGVWTARLQVMRYAIAAARQEPARGSAAEGGDAHA